ncbi:ribosome biogenesis GTPase Der [Desulfurivibrio sp. D14AmB]|uniref:ribosome biogenesis GTPase Der n=1 Tax=Desulfurivibrio sp. D14AmB TaxID=3374370 RepID=UPI00376EAFD5
MTTNNTLPLVALIGRPNVGKSSLFNRIAGSRKAIVDPTPGVTRDRHYEKVTWNERTFMLIDTGGIESDQESRINPLIQEQTRLAVAEADMVLFLLDGREGVMPEDRDVVDILRRSGKRVLYLVNKIDAPDQAARLLPPFYELGVDQLWPLSAAHGLGLSDVLDQVVAELPPDQAAESAPPPDTIKIAFIGRPNVGKSSLVNRLLGEERMVVSDLPGTTRDSVDTMLTKGDKNYLLIDTAGIRRKGKVRERVEKFSVVRALHTLERCDLALILIDAEEGVTEQDTKVIGYGLERGRACLVLLNKWDLLKSDRKRQEHLLAEVERAVHFAGYAPVHKVSALTGIGIGKLFPLLDKVHEQYSREFSTPRLNKILSEAVAAHPPAMHKGRRLKLYYVTQISSRPPTLIIFANDPKGIHFSYSRFLVNRFRDALGLDQVPLRIFFRQRQRRGDNPG